MGTWMGKRKREARKSRNISIRPWAGVISVSTYFNSLLGYKTKENLSSGNTQG